MWNSMPDEMLLDLAGTGKLHDPAVLEEEVGRMLRSPKAEAFIESFVTQWLGTRELGRDIPPWSFDAFGRKEPRERREEFFRAVEDETRAVLFRDGTWTADYRRLRIVAVAEETE